MFNTIDTGAHLLTLDDWNKTQVLQLLQRAKILQNTPIAHLTQCLSHKTIVNVFYEPSTRTRVSFELAAKRLGAQVINVTANTSSVVKGESLADTLQTIQAMGIDGIVLRHNDHDEVKSALSLLAPSTLFINGGSGTIAHPSQGLLDMLTIQQYYPDFKSLKVGIVGDIIHSRVANSDIKLLQLLGVQECRLIAPPPLLPTVCPKGITFHENLKEGLQDLDIIIMLRLQKERFPASLLDSIKLEEFCLTPEVLTHAKPNVLVMHPGPINRDIEIKEIVIKRFQHIINTQVRNGVVIRMALFEQLIQQTTN